MQTAMKVKSLCLVCRGTRMKLGDTCIGCNGLGWVLVNHIPTPKPESILEKEEVEQPVVVKPKKVRVKQELLVEEPLPPPDINRRTLRLRARSPGLYEKIIAAVREYQYDYIYSLDIMKLKPMRLKDISEIVGCDQVTVHLHLRDERINGLDVRKMFSEAVSGVSRKVVMEMIRQLVTCEVTPYSDIEIQRHLREKNITISRRTVTKFRLTLDIPNWTKRKKHDHRSDS